MLPYLPDAAYLIALFTQAVQEADHTLVVFLQRGPRIPHRSHRARHIFGHCGQGARL